MNNVHSAQRYFWNPYVVSALIDVSIFSTGNGDSMSDQYFLLAFALALVPFVNGMTRSFSES